MRRAARLAVALAALAAGPAALAATPAWADDILLESVGQTVLPGRPLDDFGTAAVDENAGRYYLPDRANAAVAILDSRTGAYRGRLPGFTGRTPQASHAGPNAVLPVDRQLWASDGDGTVKVFDGTADPPRWTANVSLGALTRADQMAYDSQDHVVVVTSPAEQPPFLSLVASRGPLRVLARINLTGGVAVGPVLFDARTRRFLVGVVQAGQGGALAVVDPQHRRVARFLSVGGCVPTGLAPGPGRLLMVTCGEGGTAAALAVNVETGAAAASFGQVAAASSAAFDRNRQRWMVATGGADAQLGVIDAGHMAWLGALAAGPGAHSVAVDSVTGRVFVPHRPDAACPLGCIAVLTAPDWLPPIGG